MSYYAVDLFSSMPAGSAGGVTAAPATIAQPEEQPVVPKEAPVTKEAIRVAGKVKKKPSAKASPQKSAAKPKSTAAFDAAMRAAEAEGNHGAGSGIPGAGGAGVAAEAGPAFPYPWYLKAIADKLDKQWHPPQQFQSDTVCQVAFVIHRDGQVSDSSVEKASGDGTFDQLALRAVVYANPLPPLPSGFPDEVLRVHMKFVGKSL
jgi:TonB family protein